MRGTVLGALGFTFYYPSEALGRIAIRDGKPDFSAQIPREQWKTLRAEEQCGDKADIQERMRRATLTGIGVDALKQLCGL